MPFKFSILAFKFLEFLRKSFQAEVHNQSNAARQFFASYIFLERLLPVVKENNYNGNPTCNLFGFETIKGGVVIRPNLIGHC